MYAVLIICQRSLLLRRKQNFHVRWPHLFRNLWRLQRPSRTFVAEPDQEAFLPSSAAASGTTKLANGSAQKSNPSTAAVMSLKQCNVTVACLSFLQFLSSYFWNRYMENYHVLLEVPANKHGQLAANVEGFQLETMRSAAFWYVFYFY